MNLGIMGLGYWGENILRNLKELGIACVACDTNPEVIRTRRREFPEVNYTQYPVDILKDSNTKAVVISTPAATHYRLARESLGADKDVFVEKPLALSSAEGEELVELAERKEKILMVGHTLQYHPAIIKLKELIEKDVLGKIRYIYSNRLNIGRLRIEENILWSFAPHDISVILMLTGQLPVKVGCFGEDYLNKGVYDTTLTTLEFQNKVNAHVFVSWLHPFKEQKLVVVGSRTMAVFDDLTEEKLFIYPHKIEWEDGGVPIAYRAEHYCVEVEKKEPLKEELKHFVECISKRETPKTDGREGLRVLKVLESAEQSLRSYQYV